MESNQRRGSKGILDRGQLRGEGTTSRGDGRGRSTEKNLGNSERSQMNKDLLANTISFGAIGAYLMEIEVFLTILVLLTSVFLNVYRIIKLKNKEED